MKNNLKRISIIKTAFCIATVMMFAACSQEEASDGTLPDGKYPLNITSATVTFQGNGQVNSRVSEATADGNSSQWTDGDEIAVRIGSASTTGKYKVNVDANGAVTDLAAETAVYWQNTQAANVTGWYPANAADGEISLSGQSAGLAYILYGQTASAVDYKTSNIALPFTHCLAKLRLKLAGTQAASVTDVEVFTYSSCAFDPDATTNKVTGAGTEKYIAMKKVTYGSDTYWEANVVPGYVIKDFRLNTNTVCTLTTTVTTVAGSLHVIDLTVGTPTTEVKIGSLYWATGNLVSDGKQGAKIGAPTDCGLYFRFGSLVGVAGGANGDGTGAVKVYSPSNTTWVAYPSGYDKTIDIWNAESPAFFTRDNIYDYAMLYLNSFLCAAPVISSRSKRASPKYRRLNFQQNSSR